MDVEVKYRKKMDTNGVMIPEKFDNCIVVTISDNIADQSSMERMAEKAVAHELGLPQSRIQCLSFKEI